ncbi:MAG: hypothetical protein K0S56_1435 [Microvirga sp.]|jgi:hypothetical protein|nr:hypothetical protein [Microvirga sp.]
MAKNPQRYRDRHEPVVTEPIGDPPEWLKPAAADAWNGLVPTLPWLNRSHRGIVAITAILAAQLAAGTAGVPAMNLLRLCLGQLFANPVSASKVTMPEPPVDDPADEFFR